MLESLVKNEKYFPYFLLKLDQSSDPVRVVRTLIYENSSKIISAEYQYNEIEAADKITYQSVRCYLLFHDKVLGEATVGFQDNYEDKARLAAYQHARTKIQSHIESVTFKSYSENYQRFLALYQSLHIAPEINANSTALVSRSLFVNRAEQHQKTKKPIGYEKTITSLPMASKSAGTQNLGRISDSFASASTQSSIASVNQLTFFRFGLNVEQAYNQPTTKQQVISYNYNRTR
ncbi:MAG: hypothetical protein ABI597_01620 [Gammaproteobacteria bacterium]